MKLDREIADAILRLDFGAFVCLSISIINPGADFAASWHIDALTWKLQRMHFGRGGNRLVVNLPPRTLKSTIVTVCFVAWLLGQDPTLKIICASYEDGLARKFSRDTRRLMESDFYRRLFPGTRLNPRKTTETEFETTRHGGRFATSVGGSLTGRGADYLIIDDPIKPQDADSEVIRTRGNEWLDKTAMSRQEHFGKSKFIVVMQRVHAYDMSGMLIERGWPRFVLPAIATERCRYPLGGGKFYTRRVGDLLQPGRDSLEYLEAYKREHGSRVFSAQYQQDPTPADGNVIKREWLKRYDAPLPSYTEIMMACDPAGKPGLHNDYTAIAVAGVCNNVMHLLDVVRGHWDIRMMFATVTELAKRWNPSTVIIEDTSTGMGLVQLLLADTRLSVVGEHPKDDKETRLLRQQAAFEAGRIQFPSEAPWLADCEAELLAFPSGRYDDQVDALLLLLERFANSPREYEIVLPEMNGRSEHLFDRFGWRSQGSNW